MTLKLNSISKYFGEKNILSNFSYGFSDSGLYLLLGESGVGKTTLLRIIAGLDNGFSGELLGGGIGRVSFCFQEYRLFPELSALDNVLIAISNTKDEAVLEIAEKLLYRLGFSKSDLSLLPSELSGGMKQRISLARAIMKDAPILLLDEPTKELDGENANAVREIIVEESKRRLVILATHNEADLLMPGVRLINL